MQEKAIGKVAELCEGFAVFQTNGFSSQVARSHDHNGGMREALFVELVLQFSHKNMVQGSIGEHYP